MTEEHRKKPYCPCTYVLLPSQLYFWEPQLLNMELSSCTLRRKWSREKKSKLPPLPPGLDWPWWFILIPLNSLGKGQKLILYLPLLKSMLRTFWSHRKRKASWAIGWKKKKKEKCKYCCLGWEDRRVIIREAPSFPPKSGNCFSLFFFFGWSQGGLSCKYELFLTGLLSGLGTQDQNWPKIFISPSHREGNEGRVTSSLISRQSQAFYSLYTTVNRKLLLN